MRSFDEIKAELAPSTVDCSGGTSGLRPSELQPGCFFAKPRIKL